MHRHGFNTTASAAAPHPRLILFPACLGHRIVHSMALIPFLAA
ncbi:hypothetical protein B4113_0998 [Geobacillus sp. B4113_201601]|nr:hypothetical protein B4113_0998 [Geobacillus sp. B4113_201601]